MNIPVSFCVDQDFPIQLYYYVNDNITLPSLSTYINTGACTPPCDCHDGTINDNGSFSYYDCSGVLVTGGAESGTTICYDINQSYSGNITDNGASETCSCSSPTPTPTPTLTETPTNTPTNTPTETLTSTPTETPTNTPTNTPTETLTSTPTETPTNTPTNTLTPTETPTNTPTETLTSTPTPTPTFNCDSTYCANNCCNWYMLNETGSPIAYSYYDCNGVLVSSSLAGGANLTFCSDQSYGPIVYGSITLVLLGCCTAPPPPPSNSPTQTTTPTETPTNTPTETLTQTPTNTPTNTLTPTETPTNTPTETPTNTPTNTPTETPTNTQTPTPTETPTNTPTETPTNTPTNTQTSTPTETPTLTPTNTETPTLTPTNTQTPTLTPTNTQTPTLTPTPTTPGIVVQFQDCENGSNIFRFGGSIGSLTLGNVYNITGSGDFSGCATVVTNTGAGQLYSANGVTFTNTLGCADPVCPRTSKVAAILSKCADGTLFYATVDEDVAFPGATYVYNGACYSFIEFSGPGGPDLGEPDFNNCLSCIVTPTPTSTSATPTPTPTITSTPLNCYCPNTVFCLNTNWVGLAGYSGTYVQNNGYYNCCHFYEGGGYNYGVIYNTGQYWCLSDSLGGACLLTGSQTCFSNCPDLDSNIFSVGACTPPPTPGPDCTILDFYAYFDCNYTTLPTPIPCEDIEIVLSAITTTPTPTPSGQYCNNVGISFSMSSYTPSSNVTPTPTPTITPTNPLSISGNVTFEVFQEQFICASVKVLVDCSSSTEYYVSDSLVYNGTPITTGMTIFVSIDGAQVCVTYDRDDSNLSSNSSVDQIYNISGGGCVGCQMTPSPTPTLTNTPTNTTTPTNTLTPTLTPTNTPTSTVTPTEGFVPSQTPTTTQTPTLTPTNTLTPTLTPTNTTTPTPSPIYVYVYQSCSPQQLVPYLENQVIQTIQVPGINQVGATFKDASDNCWRYVGNYPANYIPPINVVATTYDGNYFLGRGTTIYDNCDTCVNGNPPTGQFMSVSEQSRISGLPDGCGGYGATKTSLDVQLVDSSGQPIVATTDTTVVIELSYSDCLGTSSPTETYNVIIPTGTSSKIFEFMSQDYEPCPYDQRCTPVTRGYNQINGIYPSTITEYTP